MSDNDSPTREELEAKLAEAQATLAADTKAHKAAVKEAESAVGNVPFEQLQELFAKVATAQAAMEFQAKLVTKAQSRVDNFELEAKQDERNELVAQFQAEQATLAANFREQMLAVGVDKLTTVSDLNEGTNSVKPAGPGVTTQRAPREPRKGGNGFKSKGAIRLNNGAEYASVNRAYMELRAAVDGTEPTPANTESATRWLTKNEYTFEYINQ